MSAMAATCAIALRAFTWPDLSHFQGLPECTLAEVREVLAVPEGDWRGEGEIGEERRSLAWLNVTGGGFPDAIRVWRDGNRVQMLDSKVMGRPADLKALLKKLGAPAAKLDAYFSGMLLEKGEWVYPDRGLTLFVMPENHVPLRVAAYPRTTLDDYRKKYRFLTGKRIKR